MADSTPGMASRLFGAVLVLVGVAAFVVPLQHAGPYGVPGRGLVGGTLGILLGGLLLAGVLPRFARIAALVVSPLVLFFGLYAAFAELEEVVVLHAEDADLRLWIVDFDGHEWVSMPGSKADRHALDGARLSLLRDGETRCVVPRLDDSAEAKQRTFDLRQEKYAMQRMAVSIGMFGDGPSADGVTLRLDPCD